MWWTLVGTLFVAWSSPMIVLAYLAHGLMGCFPRWRTALWTWGPHLLGYFLIFWSYLRDDR